MAAMTTDKENVMTDFIRPTLKRIEKMLYIVLTALAVLIAIGIGTVVWSSEPESVPASDITPATPPPTTAPLTTEAPATPIIGDDEGECGLTHESCSALKQACELGIPPACIEWKQHCDHADTAVGYSGSDASPTQDIEAADTSLHAVQAMVADLKIDLDARHVIENTVASVIADLDHARELIAGNDDAHAIGALSDAQAELLTVDDQITSGVETGHITHAQAERILHSLEAAAKTITEAVDALEGS